MVNALLTIDYRLSTTVHMLKKQYRGITEAQVSELFAGDHHSIGNRLFRVNWMESDTGSPQFVVITSRKLHKSAVMRNRLRRRIYEMVRLHFRAWTEGMRVAILIKNPALECSPREFREAFVSLMTKAQLFP